MKKFYETPAVEFTGFNAEDVITTSIIETMSITEGSAAEATLLDRAKTAGAADAVKAFSSYQW